MHVSAHDILLGLREIMDEADGPVLPTTVRDTGNIQGTEDLATMVVDYGPGEQFIVSLIRIPL